MVFLPYSSTYRNPFFLFFSSLLVIHTLLPINNVDALLLYGCSVTDGLCEDGEYCFPDGVFGQCYSEASGASQPTVLNNLNDNQLELLQLELKRLSATGNDWLDDRTQCVMAYFKLSMAYGLQYDPEFCSVRNPANIWALIQLIDLGLSGIDEPLEGPAEVVEVVPAPAAESEGAYLVGNPQEDELTIVPLVVETDGVEDGLPEEEIQEILDQLKEPEPEEAAEMLEAISELPTDGDDDDDTIDRYTEMILKGQNVDLAGLTDSQLNQLLSRLVILKEQATAQKEAAEMALKGEAEEAAPLDALTGDQAEVLKKDAEELGDIRLGLDNVPHKIVKGGNAAISRVVGNRVYLKVNVKQEEQLYPLIEFLQKTIALPNDLIFDDFQFENGQLSMRISRFEGAKPKSAKRIDTVEGVAQAVYKRRKDIQRFSGAEVAETGIGIGEDSLPVESTDRDWIFMPVLFICAFTITALLSVLAVHFVRQRRHYKNNLAAMTENIEGKGSLAYQELCRQRVSSDPGVQAAGRASKSSSTSSWCEEAGTAPSIDISTGHVILNFLQEHLSDPSKIEAQWESIKNYRDETKTTITANSHPESNRAVRPYDENIVPVESWKENEQLYLNASFVYDDDPRQAVYIASQTPATSEIAQFWQAVWQHGVCLIVNLTSPEESRQEKTYWPESGSEVHGPFEIHLVSEHIWSDDYLVRSFYLKNLRTSQTRTITQFHYLSWKKDGTPTSPKSLLEFRRKVNKSYRGRSSPVLVHSWDGAGRTGVYCTVDMLCARLLRGVKQLDVVASVEHLRDQREGMVQTSEQFKLIYGCVAQEINALLKSLPQ